jgi:phosphoribosyl-ATP pyrophosphohydrolase
MFTLDDLAKTIARRAEASAETSYTRSLLDRGPAHCARKFGEEAIELAIATAAEDEDAVRAEAADVLYHLLVMLRARRRVFVGDGRTGKPRRARRARREGVPQRLTSRRHVRKTRLRRFAMNRSAPSLESPFLRFTRDEWARLRADTQLTLTIDDLRKLQSTHDPISLDEVVAIYLQLSRLLAHYVAANQ